MPPFTCICDKRVLRESFPEVLEEAEDEFGGMSPAEMHDRRMAGHGVASRF
ncbi:MAG: hypothetical protein M3R38_01360 [Actinomycetota bacterium]|nr:hypothetical protein [Actinomycetota bacterium]